MNIDLILQSLPSLLSGALVTVQLVTVSLICGLILALFVALARESTFRPLSLLAGGYIFIFRSTPLLVQIFLIYYGLGQFVAIRESVVWPFLREPWWCAVLALALNSAAYAAGIIRGGIRAVPFGQIEAARALGMSRLLVLRRVVLPLAWRQALPAYGNEVIQMVQASSLASTITLVELTGAARAIASRTFQPIEVFIIAGAIYLSLNIILTKLVGSMEQNLRSAGR
jgi:octopine/nopaline transport system permease protein